MWGETGRFRKDCPKNHHQKSLKSKHKAKPAHTSHMTQERELLVDYEEFDKPQKVCLGDCHTVEAFGKGNIHFTMVFKMSKPKKVTICNALYVPKLACNLFSVRAAVSSLPSVCIK